MFGTVESKSNDGLPASRRACLRRLIRSTLWANTYAPSREGTGRSKWTISRCWKIVGRVRRRRRVSGHLRHGACSSRSGGVVQKINNIGARSMMGGECRLLIDQYAEQFVEELETYSANKFVPRSARATPRAPTAGVAPTPAVNCSRHTSGVAIDAGSVEGDLAHGV